MELTQFYIGLMSGTSMDGVDAVLARFEPASDSLDLLGHCHTPFESTLRRSLVELNQPSFNELQAAALAANALAGAYAEVTARLLKTTGVKSSAIAAIGAHGQTVRHRPGEFDTTGYTIQLLNGARLAELTDISVVCDFRSRDVAAGGQGAPLVPAFHQAVFGKPGTPTAVLNIGGISNLTLLARDGSVGGFDCGPGNVFLDMWCQRHLGQAYDQSGQWSAGGAVSQQLLDSMLTEPFFKKAPPKSTGRDLFNQQWLDKYLSAHQASDPCSAQDTQSTLAELTARVAAEALIQYLPDAQELLVCGGGALNLDLCQRLQSHLQNLVVESTDSAGISPMHVEAAAFAWLALRFMQKKPGNCNQVTGASGNRVLGCLYPA